MISVIHFYILHSTKYFSSQKKAIKDGFKKAIFLEFFKKTSRQINYLAKN